MAHQLEGRKLNYGTNLPFGSLRLLFNHEEIGARLPPRTEPRRRHRARAVPGRWSRVSRELWIGAPHQVLVIRLVQPSRWANLPRRAGRRRAAVHDTRPEHTRWSWTTSRGKRSTATGWPSRGGRCTRLRVRADGGQISAVAISLR